MTIAKYSCFKEGERKLYQSYFYPIWLFCTLDTPYSAEWHQKGFGSDKIIQNWKIRFLNEALGRLAWREYLTVSPFFTISIFSGVLCSSKLVWLGPNLTESFCCCVSWGSVKVQTDGSFVSLRIFQTLHMLTTAYGHNSGLWVSNMCWKQHEMGVFYQSSKHCQQKSDCCKLRFWKVCLFSNDLKIRQKSKK